MIDWRAVQTILLDMDGTLLDLHFDTYFWREHLPRRYAAQQAIPLDVAKAALYERFRSAEGTLDWYCLDFWSRELGMDMVVLKAEVDHLIAVHPYVVEFLTALRAAGKRVVMVTNAHGKSLALKMEKTQLGGHFDALLCSHDFGLPKEDVRFWHALQQVERFDPSRTLLIDDSLPVLRAAKAYGVAYLLAVFNPDSQDQRRDVAEFAAIESFRDLLPIASE